MMDIMLLSVTVVVVIILWLILVDSSRFVVVHYQVNSNKIQTPYRCVVLADLHNKQFGRSNQVLLDAIRAEKPDGILVAGDMLTSKAGEGYEPAKELLEALAVNYPIFYANGNHEQRIKDEIPSKHHKNMKYNRHDKNNDGVVWANDKTFIRDYQTPLKKSGVEFLENQHVSLGDTGITLYGLEMDHDYYYKTHRPQMDKTYLTRILGQPNQGKYNVLLAHNPEFFSQYEAWGADLVLSGHIHGGMVRVPFWGKGMISPSLKLFPKYDGGRFQEGNATMLLSRGIGMHTVPIRLFNPGEIMVVELSHGDTTSS
jgi:predicted MPP superfamily phosphohydrolase